MPACPTNLTKMREQDALNNERRKFKAQEEIKRESGLRNTIELLKEAFAAKHNVPVESVQVISCNRRRVLLGA